MEGKRNALQFSEKESEDHDVGLVLSYGIWPSLFPHLQSGEKYHLSCSPPRVVMKMGSDEV